MGKKSIFLLDKKQQLLQFWSTQNEQNNIPSCTMPTLTCFGAVSRLITHPKEVLYGTKVSVWEGHNQGQVFTIIGSMQFRVPYHILNISLVSKVKWKISVCLVRSKIEYCEITLQRFCVGSESSMPYWISLCLGQGFRWKWYIHPKDVLLVMLVSDIVWIFLKLKKKPTVHTIISVCMARTKIDYPACSKTHPEEVLCGTWVQCAILDLSLFGKVISRFNGSQHTLHSQEGSQVSSVRWDDDQSEEPPYTSNYSTWHRPVFKKSSFFLRLLMEIRESLFHADMASSNF